MRIVTCRSGVNGLPAAAPATASGSACGASRRWRRATARAVTRLGAIWGTHLWGGDGVNHGKIMGKPWENLGRVYEHVHHIFIICSSYVHRFASKLRTNTHGWFCLCVNHRGSNSRRQVGTVNTPADLGRPCKK